MNAAILRNQCRLALEIVAEYKGDMPFHLFLQQEFRKNPKFGSRDRKTLRNLTYLWFRIARTIPVQKENALLTAHALFLKDSSWFEDYYKIPLPEDPFNWLQNQFPEWSLFSMFPLHQQLSPSIDKEQFIRSHVSQPLLWIWTPLHSEITQFLTVKGVECIYSPENKMAIGLPNGFNLETIPEKWSRTIMVQDLSSQHICSHIQTKEGEALWDCCAASGGKSLKVWFQNRNIQLFVSDVRSSILQNLDKRFRQIGINKYCQIAINLEQSQLHLEFLSNNREKTIISHGTFDRIILDAPCSGSGTWARNPEGLMLVDSNAILNYQDKQKRILKNVWPFLKPGGVLHYITCSVYKSENEDVINGFGATEADANIVSMDYFEGYLHKSDSMFSALIRKK